MTTGTAMAPIRGYKNLLRLDPFNFLQTPFSKLMEPWALPFSEETFPLTAWNPACDIYETDKELVLKAELPGLRKENVNVTVENNVLMIQGERKFEEETKKENFHRVERNYGRFIRSFTLPTFVDAGKILAEFKDGILMVTLPKREEAKPKQIEVKIK